MIDFPWQSVRWRRRPLDSEFQTKPHFVICGSDSCSMSGKRFLRTIIGKISSKTLLEIKTHRQEFSTPTQKGKH